MAEGQQGQVWRVVAHEGLGVWRVRPQRYRVAGTAQQAAARLVSTGQSSNAGVYPEVDGVVQTPQWMRVRERD